MYYLKMPNLQMPKEKPRIKVTTVKEVVEAKKTWKHWSGSDDSYLSEFYGNAKTKQIAKALGRTVGATRTRARKLNLTKG